MLLHEELENQLKLVTEERDEAYRLIAAFLNAINTERIWPTVAEMSAEEHARNHLRHLHKRITGESL